MIAGLDGQLEVKPNLDRLPQQANVAVLNVAAVFAEVDRDDVGASQLGQHGRPDRVGLAPSSRLAKRGDMIDVDTQAWHLVISPQYRRSAPPSGHGEPSPPARAGAAALGGLAHGPQRRLGQNESSRGADGKRDPPLAAGALAFEATIRPSPNSG